MVRTIEEIQAAGIEPDIWKIEGVDEPADCARHLRHRPGRRTRRRGLRRARPRRRRRQGRRVATGRRQGARLHRLRHRPLDLLGRREGLVDGSIEHDAAAEQIGANYLRFIDVYKAG